MSVDDLLQPMSGETRNRLRRGWTVQAISRRRETMVLAE